MLKGPQVGKNIPTVAQMTQGEVVGFAGGAAEQMRADGMNVLMEGRAQVHKRTYAHAPTCIYALVHLCTCATMQLCNYATMRRPSTTFVHLIASSSPYRSLSSVSRVRMAVRVAIPLPMPCQHVGWYWLPLGF